jgi:hypothetical protein
MLEEHWRRQSVPMRPVPWSSIYPAVCYPAVGAEPRAWRTPRSSIPAIAQANRGFGIYREDKMWVAMDVYHEGILRISRMFGIEY